MRITPMAALAMLLYGTMTLSMIAILLLILSVVIKNTLFKNIAFVCGTLYAFLLAFIKLTAGPDNYISVYIISGICFILALSGFLSEIILKKPTPVGYSLLMLSIIIGTLSTTF